MPESKQCVECDATFFRPAHRSHAQWASMRCCSTRCANTIRARGRPRQQGDLDRSAGKRSYQLAWEQRKAMPQWAAWWEARRRAEDQAELDRVLLGGPACPISQAPKRRQFINGSCPNCGDTVTVIRGWWNGSIRCPPCTKARWRETHYERAARYGLRFDVIVPARVFERDGWRCQICGRKTQGAFPSPRSPSLDHIVPMARGGHHVLENLQCACLACNVKKGANSANDQLRLAI